MPEPEDPLENIWVGVVGGEPCVSYVRAGGQGSPELEIDAMAFIRDAAARSIALPGSTALSGAVGFEILGRTHRGAEERRLRRSGAIAQGIFARRAALCGAV